MNLWELSYTSLICLTRKPKGKPKKRERATNIDLNFWAEMAENGAMATLSMRLLG